MQRTTRRILLAWLVVGVWVAVILGFASDGFSASSTSRFLTPFLRWLDPAMPWERIRELHFLVRKGAHVFEYAVLAALAFRAFRISLAVSAAHVALLTLAVVLTVAGLDEWRQSFIPTRTGTLADVALDCAGGAMGVLLLIALHRWLGVGSPVPPPRAGVDA